MNLVWGDSGRDDWRRKEPLGERISLERFGSSGDQDERSAEDSGVRETSSRPGRRDHVRVRASLPVVMAGWGEARA
jgi:hypothetical protein